MLPKYTTYCLDQCLIELIRLRYVARLERWKIESPPEYLRRTYEYYCLFSLCYLLTYCVPVILKCVTDNDVRFDAALSEHVLEYLSLFNPASKDDSFLCLRRW